MGIPGAYLDIKRHEHELRPAAETIGDYDDIVIDLPLELQQSQASRCMSCGVPFCQSNIAFNGTRKATGCPLHNLIPESNDLLCRGRIDEAAARLALTNPFPEFTGRVCPAPCEMACNLGCNDDPVTIHDNERAISDYLWQIGIEPLPKPAPSAALVSIIGSGPAGLAAAWELARLGLRVRVYERDDRPGGLLMYGIPNMKLEKRIVMRRTELMEQSGIEFICNTDAASIANEICAESDAVIVACGSRTPRALSVPGADLGGIHFAVDYLTAATRALLDGAEVEISAQGKDVVVIGGGDTGTDCVATALRQGANSVRQVIRAQQPAQSPGAASMWPASRAMGAKSYGQREIVETGGQDPRLYGTDTTGFDSDDAGNVAAVRTRPMDAAADADEASIPAQLVLIAKGFVGADKPLLEAFGVAQGDECGAQRKVFVAGDARNGSSIVASAIADGLDVARAVFDSLSGK